MRARSFVVEQTLCQIIVHCPEGKSLVGEKTRAKKNCIQPCKSLHTRGSNKSPRTAFNACKTLRCTLYRVPVPSGEFFSWLDMTKINLAVMVGPAGPKGGAGQLRLLRSQWVSATELPMLFLMTVRTWQARVGVANFILGLSSLFSHWDLASRQSLACGNTFQQ